MKEKRIKTRKREPMVDKELIGIWKKTLKPSISSWLLKTNYEGLGEQDKEEFERDFDEILDLALIGLKYKAQPPVPTCDGCRHVGTYDTNFPCSRCIRREKDYYVQE